MAIMFRCKYMYARVWGYIRLLAGRRTGDKQGVPREYSRDVCVMRAHSNQYASSVHAHMPAVSPAGSYVSHWSSRPGERTH